MAEHTLTLRNTTSAKWIVQEESPHHEQMAGATFIHHRGADVMNRIFLLFTLAVIIGGASREFLHAQPVTRCPNPEQSLSSRWDWALKEGGRQSTSTIWIGYSIVKPMRRNAFIGTLYSDARRNSPTLCEILGLDVCVRESTSLRSMRNFTMTEGMTYIGDEDGGGDLVDKELGILFETDIKNKNRISSVVISNFSLHAELRDIPVMWLGEAKASESLPLLIAQFHSSDREKVQKKMLFAAGMHEPTVDVVSFLGGVLQGSERIAVRKEAAFWLGQTNSDEAMNILLKSAENETSSELREESIFALSQMDGGKGTEPLIKLARTGNNREVRSKAMFWLGQMASEKSTRTLKDIVANDEDTEIQKSALFALMQSESGGGVDALISVATTHHNPEVRKQAIYLLGESDDSRALDVLVGILRDK